MKIRQGFVSNSSSSSFIVVAKELKLEELKNEKSFHVLGNYLGDGRDFFEVETGSAIYNFITSKDFTENVRFLKVVYKDSDEELSLKNVKGLLDTIPDFEEYKIMTFEIDYHTTGSWDEFYETYVH